VVVQSFFITGVLPNATNSVQWDGTGSDGRPVASGWYAFRIATQNGQLARATTSQAPNLGVAVYGYIFPIRPASAPHSYGDGLGAGRGHQGQDVMAACGTKLVAARGGRVQYSGYQGRAGNYIVIDLKGSGEDHAYMHLEQPSPLAAGQRVRTGQRIGKVGNTGNSSACHLHFERWSAPGWYEGGAPVDPPTPLKQWDKYS
jgi:murein DD-endopeptidase MepM/ murein hydrolase activator NlpD